MVEGPLPAGMKVICRMILAGGGEKVRQIFCDINATCFVFSQLRLDFQCIPLRVLLAGSHKVPAAF